MKTKEKILKIIPIFILILITLLQLSMQGLAWKVDDNEVCYTETIHTHNDSCYSGGGTCGKKLVTVTEAGYDGAGSGYCSECNTHYNVSYKAYNCVCEDGHETHRINLIWYGCEHVTSQNTEGPNTSTICGVNFVKTLTCTEATTKSYSHTASTWDYTTVPGYRIKTCTNAKCTKGETTLEDKNGNNVVVAKLLEYEIGLYNVKFVHDPNQSANVASNYTNKEETYGSAWQLPTVTKQGYTLDGWYTAATGGSKINTSQNVSITSDTTLYAHWKPITYTIKYNGNGSTSGSTNSTTFTYDTITKF